MTPEERAEAIVLEIYGDVGEIVRLVEAGHHRRHP